MSAGVVRARPTAAILLLAVAAVVTIASLGKVTSTACLATIPLDTIHQIPPSTVTTVQQPTTVEGSSSSPTFSSTLTPGPTTTTSSCTATCSTGGSMALPPGMLTEPLPPTIACGQSATVKCTTETAGGDAGISFVINGMTICQDSDQTPGGTEMLTFSCSPSGALTVDIRSPPATSLCAPGPAMPAFPVPPQTVVNCVGF